MSREITAKPRTSQLETGLRVTRGRDRLHPLRDLFFTLMTASWPTTIAVMFVIYVAFNTVFALIYIALGGAIDNARHGNFEDAFFFSVQTMATIGYGSMTPRGTFANVIVSVEAMGGVISAALTTGLVFAKFSRPTARVLFSHIALIGNIDGKPVLMFRMANERASRIVEASVHVVLLREEVTSEGVTFRRMHDLKLQRARSPVFSLTWTVFHSIDEASPLFGETAESLADKKGALIVSFAGTDETLTQVVHARHAYDAESVIFGAHFVDVFRVDDKERTLDLTRLHTYVHDDDAAAG
jgi:inward rectifier potassium channel